MAIQSFADSRAEAFFIHGRVGKKVGWRGLQKVVLRKLDMLHYAHALADLRSPPGNQLEALKGDLQGRHSIRVNDRWRIVFRWTDRGPVEVKIVDYHH